MHKIAQSAAYAAVAAAVVVASVAVSGGEALPQPHGGYAAAPLAAYAGAAGAPLAYAAAAPVVAKVAALEPVYPPQPYSFGYETVDEFGTKSARHEESDGHNNKKGSYSFTDAHGISRRVDYVADAAGFRATVNTNEPGTAPSAPAAAVYNAPVALKKIAVAAAAPVAAYAHAPVYGAHY